ncbi:MAG: toll/interleukin-1 receptor domain-containing protein [Lachnospiraceae bacterium]|nr:toll/interleukin-1 receptor domain-containing protein [Lachnospiraceae bacterium]
MDTYRYKAFISYRHISPDDKIAEKLHSLIENYSIPKAIRDFQGISKMGRVFRDKEELPLSSNLGDDIHQALENSEWLICICSPEFLKSKWCAEEINYFISLGRHDHILTVLVDGEPEEAFPEALRFEEIDGVRIEKEPLAADVRADSVEESIKKLQNEKLRIFAPMLGVNYDDLKQRARQRKNRITAGILGGIIVLLAAFSTYAIIKNNQVSSERNTAQISQSKYLAQAADGILDDSGDARLAALLSMEALPEDFDNPDRPVTQEALYTLRSSLVSSLANEYEVVKDFDIDIKSFRAYGDVLAMCSDDVDGYICAYDLNSGMETTSGFNLGKSPFQLVFSSDLKTVLYTDSSGINRMDINDSGDAEHRLLYQYGYFNKYDFPIAVTEDCNGYVFTQSGFYVENNLTTENSNREVQKNNSALVGIDRPVIYPREFMQEEPQDGTYYLTRFMGHDEARSDLVLMRAGDFEEVFTENVVYSYFVEEKYEEINESLFTYYYPSYDGTKIIALCGKGVHIFDTYSQQQLDHIPYTNLDGSYLEILCASSVDSHIAFTTQNGGLYIYDYDSGRLVTAETEGLPISTLHFNEDGSRLLCSSGNNCLIVGIDGKVIQNIYVNFELTDAAFAYKDVYGNGTDDSFILLVGEGQARLLKESSKTSTVITNVGAWVERPDQSAITTNGKEVWYLTSGLMEFHVVSRDIETGEEEIVRAYNFQDEPCKYYIYAINDQYMSVSGKDGEGSVIYIYDTETHELLHTLRPQAEGIDFRDGSTLSNNTYKVSPVGITPDGKYVIYKGEEFAIYVYEIGTFEEKYNYMEAYNWSKLEFEVEDHLLRIHQGLPNGNASSRHKTQVIDMDTWERTGNEESFFCHGFAGILTDCEVKGFSDMVSVYLYDCQTHIVDMKNDNEVVIDLDGISKVALSEDKKGIILYSSIGRGQCYYFDGQNYTESDYDTAEFEKIEGTVRVGDTRSYYEGGVLMDEASGSPMLDFKCGDIVILGSSSDGSRVLLYKEGETTLYVLDYLEGNNLLEAAREYLGSRELTNAEKEKYFIE